VCASVDDGRALFTPLRSWARARLLKTHFYCSPNCTAVKICMLKYCSCETAAVVTCALAEKINGFLHAEIRYSLVWRKLLVFWTPREMLIINQFYASRDLYHFKSLGGRERLYRESVWDLNVEMKVLRILIAAHNSNWHSISCNIRQPRV
jgi:hypothetical protein